MFPPVWVNPRAAGKTLRQLARTRAEDDASRGIDWVSLRREKERAVLGELFGGRARGQLDTEEQAQLDMAVDSDLQQRRTEIIQQAVPQLAARFERQVGYLETLEVALLCLSLDPREFRLSLRTHVPLDQ